MRKRIGSLFSGYGGLDLAVSEVTGAEVAWHCEWEDAPSAILERNFPGVPNYRDVTQVDFSTVERVDILTGGFPCQDLSLAGKRAGLKEGTRSGLWSEFARAIETIRPELVVIENVRGLLSATAHSDVEHCSWCLGDDSGEPPLRALGAVLGDLADLGFDAKWTGVRASDAGAPHARFRIFIVAYKGWVELMRTPSAIEGQGGASSAAVKKANGNMLMLRDQMADLVSDNGMKSSVSALLPTVVTTDASGSRNSTANRSGGSRHHVGQTLTDVLLPTPTTREHKDGQAQVIRDGKVQTDTVTTAVINSGEVTPISWGKFEPAIRRWEYVIGREAPAPTKPDGKENSHRLSSKFTEWMMGLPDGWITDCGLTRNEELKACGNGVVPQQAVLALRQLLFGEQSQTAEGGK